MEDKHKAKLMTVVSKLYNLKEVLSDIEDVLSDKYEHLTIEQQEENTALYRSIEDILDCYSAMEQIQDALIECVNRK